MTQPDVNPEGLLEFVHDLRAPLTAIRACAEMMERNPNRSYLPQLMKNVARLEHLLADVLNAGAPCAEATTRELCLNDLVREIVEEVGVDSRASIEIDPAERVGGIWDPAHLRRVIVNLLDNALKYARAGTKIRVGLRHDRNEAVLSVHNFREHGEPLDPSRIFAAFERGADARTGSVQGWGIGLWVVRRIVDEYHGSVSVDCLTPDEVQFTVRLPRKR
jgi:signal transduction histidine kinase